MVCPLPYWVNADFLLNPERAYIISNFWNEFLLQEIARNQFIWAQKLAIDKKYKSQILTILTRSIAITAQPLKLAFENGVKQGMKEVKCIPKFFRPSEHNMLTIDRAMNDQIGFYSEFHEVFPGKELERVADYTLKNKELFITDNYNYEQILDNMSVLLDTIIKLPLKSRFQWYTKFLSLLSRNRDVKFIKYLKDTPFLLSEKGKFLKAEKLFHSNVGLSSVFESDVEFLHSQITDNDVRRWILYDIQVQSLSSENIIKKIIVPMIDKKRITKDSIIPITLFLFNSYNAGEWNKQSLDPITWAKLLQLGVLTKKGIVDLSEAFLSSPYSNLESKLGENDSFSSIFVSDCYLESFNSELKQQQDEEKKSKWVEENDVSMKLETTPIHQKWKDFFKLFSVKETIKMEQIQILNLPQIKANNYFFDYLKFVCSQDSEIPSGSFQKESTKLENIVVIPFFEHLPTSPYYEKLFWDAVIENWSKITNQGFPLISVAGSKRKNCSMSFLQYYFQNNSVLHSMSSHNLFPSNKLYSPKLQSFISEISTRQSLNIVKLGVELKEDQINYFGFVTTLTVEDIIKCLEDCAKQANPMPKVYALIYEHMIQSSSKYSQSDLTKLQRWNGTLLAYDNTQVNKSRLKCFAIKDEFIAEVSNKYIGPESSKLPRDLLVSVSKLLGIQVIDNAPFRFEDKKLDTTTLDYFRLYLPSLAIIEAQKKNKNKDFEKVKKIMFKKYEKLYQLKLFSVSNISRDGVKSAGSTRVKAVCLKEKNEIYFIIPPWNEQFAQKIGVEYLGFDPATIVQFAPIFGNFNTKTEKDHLIYQSFATSELFDSLTKELKKHHKRKSNPNYEKEKEEKLFKKKEEEDRQREMKEEKERKIKQEQLEQQKQFLLQQEHVKQEQQVQFRQLQQQQQQEIILQQQQQQELIKQQQQLLQEKFEFGLSQESVTTVTQTKQEEVSKYPFRHTLTDQFEPTNLTSTQQTDIPIKESPQKQVPQTLPQQVKPESKIPTQVQATSELKSEEQDKIKTANQLHQEKTQTQPKTQAIPQAQLQQEKQQTLNPQQVKSEPNAQLQQEKKEETSTQKQLKSESQSSSQTEPQAQSKTQLPIEQKLSTEKKAIVKELPTEQKIAQPQQLKQELPPLQGKQTQSKQSPNDQQNQDPINKTESNNINDNNSNVKNQSINSGNSIESVKETRNEKLIEKQVIVPDSHSKNENNNSNNVTNNQGESIKANMKEIRKQQLLFDLKNEANYDVSENSTHVDSNEEDNDYDSDDSDDNFHEFIKPDLINFGDPIIHFDEGFNGFELPSNKNQVEFTEELNQSYRRKIGRWGEEATYYKLEEDFLAQYPNGDCQETDTGFKIVQPQNNELICEVIWWNKVKESSLSKDITLITPSFTKTRAQINVYRCQDYEVKTTTQMEPSEIILSTSAYQEMCNNTNYRIMRVYNAGTAFPKFCEYVIGKEQIENMLVRARNGINTTPKLISIQFKL